MPLSLPKSRRGPSVPKLSIRSLLLGGGLVLTFGVGGMGAWAALAPLHSAVVAPGVLVPESGRKTVKHGDGGIIGEVLVKEGDAVSAGQVLLRLDPTEEQARLEMLTGDWLAKLALEARLEAEVLDREDVAWPQALLDRAGSPDASKLIADQQEIFSVRRTQTQKEEELLRERVASLKAEAHSLAEQRSFTEAELGFLRQELDATQKLLSKGNAPRSKLLEGQKEQARLQARDQELAARIAQAHQQTAEAEAEIAANRNERREKALLELNATRTEIVKLAEQRRDAANRLSNREIKAPEAGLVVGLRHLAAGGVIAANEPIFDIVPGEQDLLVEARVQPQDIDAVVPGMETRLVLSAYDSRIVGTLEGTVEHVSADRLVDQATQQPYYLTRIRLEDATPHVVHDLRIVPGMPVEAQILVSPRTPLDYLIAPITQSYNKAFIQQ